MPSSGIAGSYGNSIFNFFKGNSIVFFILAAPVYIHTNNVGEFPFLHTLSGTSFFFLFYFIFKLYIIVLVLPSIKMNPPQVYMCSPS